MKFNEILKNPLLNFLFFSHLIKCYMEMVSDTIFYRHNIRIIGQYNLT